MKLNRRIVGGREAGKDEFPFATNIQYAHDKRSLQCVGTIVHSQVIIVPAFCVVHPDTHQPVDHRDLVVGYGSIERSKQRHARVVKVVVNHEFVPKEMTNDIALLQVEPLDLSGPSVQRIPVYTGTIHAGKELEVMGWGNDQATGGAWSEKLKTTSVVVSDSNHCRQSANYNGVEGRVLCTENQLRPGHDLCDGEFGASLVGRIDGQLQLFGTYSYHTDMSPEGYNKCAKNSSLEFYTHIYSYIGFVAATAQIPIDELTARTTDEPHRPNVGADTDTPRHLAPWIILALLPVFVAVAWALVRFVRRHRAKYSRLSGGTYELAPRAVNTAASDSDSGSLPSPRAEIMDIPM
ncbi:hypothetical protein IWW54_004536 [Coemansia sp. RSA 2705]|nr:hypothetical protein IWW54_004536 [Coemansia sp. RSA 2705]